MGSTNALKETTRVTSPVATNTLSVNVFTAPGKVMVGERPKPFGEPNSTGAPQELWRKRGTSSKGRVGNS